MKHSDIVAVTHNKKQYSFYRKSTKMSTHGNVYHSKFVLWKYYFSFFVKDPHACEKKPILTGHQQAHAKQEKVFIVHFVLLSEHIQNFIYFTFSSHVRCKTFLITGCWIFYILNKLTRNISLNSYLKKRNNIIFYFSKFYTKPVVVCWYLSCTLLCIYTYKSSSNEIAVFVKIWKGKIGEGYPRKPSMYTPTLLHFVWSCNYIVLSLSSNFKKL